MVSNDEKLVICLCTRHRWDWLCIALATYFQKKFNWKLSKPKEGLPASETWANTKAGGRGMARAGEGAGPSVLRPLAIQPLWWDIHGFEAAETAASQLPPSPPLPLALSFHPLSGQFSCELTCNRCMAGNEALWFFLSYFSPTSIPCLTQLWHRKNNRRRGRQGHNQNHV